MAKPYLAGSENTAPFWLKKTAKKDVFGKRETNLSEEEVQAKVFTVLQMCEDLFLLEVPIEYEAENSELGLAHSILRSVEKKETDDETHSKDKGSKKNTEAKEYREKLKSQIEIALESNQVWEALQPHLESELKLFASHRTTLRKIRSAQQEIDTLEEAGQVLTFQAKQDHGRLTADEKSILKQFKDRRQTLSSKTQTIIDTNEDVTLDGFMAFANLRDYKTQISKDGFVETPSIRETEKRMIESLNGGKTIYLQSPTGTGKTVLAKRVLKKLTKQSPEVVRCHEGMTTRDFRWYQELIGGETVWEPRGYEKAKTNNLGLLIDEASIAPNRVLLEMKEDLFSKDNRVPVIFTGNPKDEHTQDRERMDPALLREMTGIKMSYMPPNETRDIILAGLSKSWGIPLSREEVGLIEKLCKAASEMQQLHMLNGGDIDAKETLGYDENDLIRNKFLDPGTLFSLFLEWEKDRAEGKAFPVYLGEQLTSFIEDNGTLRMPEENVLLQKILHKHGVITSATGEITSPHLESKQGYILPSEMGFLMPKRSRKVKYLITSPSEAPLSSSEMELALEKITDKRMTLEELMKGLESLRGVKVEGHNKSYQEAKEARDKIYSNPKKRKEIVEMAGRLTEKSRHKRGVLVHDPWPEKIIVDFRDGEGPQIKALNIDTVVDILRKEFVKTANVTKSVIFDEIDRNDSIMNRTWEPKVGIWTSECLDKTWKKSYLHSGFGPSQLQKQEQYLGKYCKVSEDIVIAMILHYIVTGEGIITEGPMNLNVTDTVGHPYYIESLEGIFYFGVNQLGFTRDAGIGGAYGVYA